MGRAELTKPASRLEDLLWVAGFLGLGLASRIVELRGPRSDIALGGRRLPPMCAFRLITGRRCPACGSTRAFLYMFRLEPGNAVRANLFSPITFALATVASLRAAIRLAARTTPRRSR